MQRRRTVFVLAFAPVVLALAVTGTASQQPSGGLAASDRVLGLSPLELERRWRASVASVEPAAKWSVIAREINRRGCE